MTPAASPGDVSANVLFGKEGWLFLWQGGQSQFDFLTGAKSPEKSSLDNFAANIASRHAICAARGIPYLHVVYPSKPVIDTEFVPDGIRERVQSLFERCYAKTLGPDILGTVFYPRDILLEARRRAPMFLRRDTHMTAMGDAVLTPEILRRLGHDHDPLDHMDMRKIAHKSDLDMMLGIEEPVAETTLVPRGIGYRLLNNRPFLPGNTDSVAIVHNPASVSTRRLLALGDSFLLHGLGCLSTFFGDILYVRSDVFQPELLDLFAPDAVLTANAERFLSEVKHDDTADSVVMRGYGRPGYEPSADFVNAFRAQLSRRHYPAVYRAWAARMVPLSFGKLGLPRLNSHIAQQPGNTHAFDITGHDPQFVFSNPSIETEKAYRLRIVMDSTVAGVAQLFFALPDGPDGRFSEALSVRRPVREGTNTLEFDLPAQGRGRALRFDPLQRSGSLQIHQVEVTDLPSVATQAVGGIE